MDRIIVKANADMQRVIDWAAELTGEAMALPFPEGEIEFQEEGVLLKFREESSPWVEFELFGMRSDGVYVKIVDFRGDVEAVKVADVRIAAVGEQAKVVRALLLADGTPIKGIRKFRALMLFAAYYREDLERTKVTGGGTKGVSEKRMNRRARRRLGIRRYTVSAEMLSELPEPKDKREWRGYKESFGVRGHYRQYKSGKRVWVRPYTKHGRTDKTSDREFIL